MVLISLSYEINTQNLPGHKSDTVANNLYQKGTQATQYSVYPG
jgi:hypothetical protein